MQRNSNLHSKLILVFITHISFSACDPGDGRLSIVNESNDTIFYVTSSEDSLSLYPLQISDRGEIDWENSNYIFPRENKSIGVLGDWEDGINGSSDSSLRIFIFTNKLIRGASKDSIIHYQLYSKKFKLKVRDLQNMNWKVLYQ